MSAHPLLSRALGSIRVRAAVYFVAASVCAALVVGQLYGVIEGQARNQVEAGLDRQARTLARSLVNGGRDNANATVAQAVRYLTDTRVVVRIDGIDTIWNVPAGRTYAAAQARNRWASVTLERMDPISTVDRRVLALVIAIGIGAVGVVAWFLSGSLTRRLRNSYRELVAVAGKVSEGDLTVRAAETAGEAGIVAKAFNRMASQLEIADSRQRAFIADAAHELRTPVTAIEGFATALADGTARTDEDREEAAETIREEAVRLRGLVRDLQELTWLDLDPPVERAEVDLAEIARSVVARYHAAAAARGVTLSGPRDGERELGWTDEGHVSTIVANLVSNAVSATGEGGRVTVAARVQGRDALLSVADTGVGIEPEQLPYIFDRLFRVDGSRRRTGMGGSGLGLAIVKRLVTLVDGTVSVTSTPGIGTVFTVRLRGVRSLRPGRPGAVRP